MAARLLISEGSIASISGWVVANRASTRRHGVAGSSPTQPFASSRDGGLPMSGVPMSSNQTSLFGLGDLEPFQTALRLISAPLMAHASRQSLRVRGALRAVVRPWARGFCPHGRPGPLGFGLCGRLPRHGVGGFMFNSSSSSSRRSPAGLVASMARR